MSSMSQPLISASGNLFKDRLYYIFLIVVVAHMYFFNTSVTRAIRPFLFTYPLYLLDVLFAKKFHSWEKFNYRLSLFVTLLRIVSVYQ